MTVEKILRGASGGTYFATSTNNVGSFMAFKAINGDAVIKPLEAPQFPSIVGISITIREGDVHWYLLTRFDVTGEVLAYDAN